MSTSNFDNNDTVKVIIVEPGKEPMVKYIHNTLSALQDVVEGYIQCLFIAESLALICNEEGLLLSLEPNRVVGSNLIVGTFLIVAHDGMGECVSLTDKQVHHALSMLKQGDV